MSIKEKMSELSILVNEETMQSVSIDIEVVIGSTPNDTSDGQFPVNNIDYEIYRVTVEKLSKSPFVKYEPR